MRFLTAAILLTLLFCTVSAFSEETAEGFNQNPEYSIPAPASVIPDAAKPVRSAEEDWAKPTNRTEQHGQKTNDQTQNGDHNNQPAGRKSQGNSYRRETVRTEYNGESHYIRERDRDLKDWENSNSPVPSGLPRVSNFHPRTHSNYSRNYRNYKNYYWSDNYYYRSSSPRIRVYNNNNGRTRIRVRNHR